LPGTSAPTDATSSFSGSGKSRARRKRRHGAGMRKSRPRPATRSRRMARPTTERDFALEVVTRLREGGFEALWAGGCVRDELLGLTPHDYDVATSARPEEVQRLFRRTIAVGASFGVVEVLGPRVADAYLKVQVATFRSDGTYDDGRHPTSVVF